MDASYRFGPAALSPEELARTSAFLRHVFPHARHLIPDYLDWNYRRSPDGAAIGFNAFAGDEMVAHMVAMPIRVRLEGEAASGILLQNCAVHPNHRGRKLQTQISECIFDEAAHRGHQFILAAGNAYSTGPMLTRRFKMLKPLDARIGFGAPPRRRPGTTASFERCWSDAALRWRSANPVSRYGIRGGRLLARTPWPGISAILHEQTGLPDTNHRMPGPLRLWIGLDPAMDWRRSGFVSIPQRLRPSPLNLVIRSLQSEQICPDPDRLVFRAADFDAF